jgi:hypothetical protein
MRYAAAFWMQAVLVFCNGCGDTYDCSGIICDECEPGQDCCAGHRHAMYEEEGEESDRVRHFCLDTPPQTCPLDPL